MRKNKCIVLCLILCLTGVSHGFFEDYFETADPNVVGQNGWVSNYNAGTAMATLVKSGSIVYDGLGWNDGAYVWSGAARDVTGDVVDGLYEMIVTFHGQKFISGSTFQLSVGDAGVADANPDNHLTLVYDTRYPGVALYRHINGVYEHLGATVSSHDPDVWGVHDIKITVDLNAGTASVYSRDVDDVTLSSIGDWFHEGDWNFDLPMTTITQAGIAASNYKYVYRFQSGFDPGPPSCAAALAEGYDLPYDLNKDCYVNLLDFAMFAQDWMRCITPGVTGCEEPWLDW